MRIFILAILFVLIVTAGFSQENSTTFIKDVEIDEVIITATRTKRKLIDIPARIDIINANTIKDHPANNIDDLLKTSANVYVNRSWGIFSKNSSVTMRGLESSQRTLVLVDGVPKNRLGGGSVNWHNINIDNIERIEVIKGPASSLYGNNAMGGVINLISKKPQEKLAGSISAFYGTYNSLGGSLNLLGSDIEKNKGFYWNLNGFYRKGDGYVYENLEFIDYTDVETFLKENGGGLKLGYQFSEDNSLEIVYDIYDEIRGAGTKVFTDDGSYEAFITNQVRAKYTDRINDADINAVVYYSSEDYHKLNESLNSYDEYKLLDSYSFKYDLGLYTTVSKELFKNNTITFGGEVKSGSVEGKELYRTSSDEIYFASKMDIGAVFIQDEIDLSNSNFKLIAGLRSDFVKFRDGYQSVNNPTKATGFNASFSEEFDSKNWYAISPKLALQYKLSNSSKIYTSYSVGFMPPKLKDLSQTGKIRKGFRMANPNLEPEYLTNYEIGYSNVFRGIVEFNSAIYYSHGDNFLYMTGTGDSIDTGGSSLKPVLVPENVAKVGIVGGEISIKAYLSKKLSINTSYSYNSSTILEFNNPSDAQHLDLEGKMLVEVSPHLFYAGLSYKNRLFNTNINCNYVDEQFFDTENTIVVQDYFIVNLRISKTLKRHYNLYLDIQNLFDNEYVDRKGRLSPGIFIVTGFKYNI